MPCVTDPSPYRNSRQGDLQSMTHHPQMQAQMAAFHPVEGNDRITISGHEYNSLLKAAGSRVVPKEPQDADWPSTSIDFAEIACEAMRLLDAIGKTDHLSLSTRRWWKDHKRRDSEAVEKN